MKVFFYIAILALLVSPASARIKGERNLFPKIEPTAKKKVARKKGAP